MAIVKILTDNPRYALMRGVARFSPVRSSVAGLKWTLGRGAAKRHERELVSRMQGTMFGEMDRHAFLDELNARGCAFGLRLPAKMVADIRAYADRTPVYAYRDEKRGFLTQQRAQAEALLSKEILIAQYYNTESDCPTISRLASDPWLNWIALHYLGSVPKYLGCNLWWTYPVRPNREEQLKHAHFFHRDIDDFKFLKFFFYLTDVEPGDGGHWLVSGSHKRPPYLRFKDRLLLRRFEDAEIESYYDRSDILEVVGESGVGFAEDTLCVHKAATPSKKARLILQLQFGLFDFDSASDVRDSAQLRMLSAAGSSPPA
jgi:hypothetical protein